METAKLFEVATRKKIRFPFKGIISVEDLWDLSLTNLDSVFKTLNLQVKQSKEESLLSEKSKEDETLETQINIVKYIVSVKLAEKAEREQAVEKRELKQKLLAVKAKRQNEAMENMSEEEIDKKLAELS